MLGIGLRPDERAGSTYVVGVRRRLALSVGGVRWLCRSWPVRASPRSLGFGVVYVQLFDDVFDVGDADEGDNVGTAISIARLIVRRHR